MALNLNGTNMKRVSFSDETIGQKLDRSIISTVTASKADVTGYIKEGYSVHTYLGNRTNLC